MKCFTSCFQPSKYRRIQKTRNKTALVHEHSEGDKQHKEVQPFEALIDLIADSKEECEKQLNFSSRKKVTFDLNVQVQAYEDIKSSTTLEAPELNKEDTDYAQKEVEEDAFSDAEKEVEEDAFSDSITSSSGFITYQPSHGLNNFRSSNDECEDMKLEGSELVNDADGGDGDQNGFHQEESYDSLFSISLDSKKRTVVGDLGDKEVNSPFKKSVHNVVVNHVEGLIQLKPIKTKSKSLPSLNQAGNEDVNMERQFCNQPNSKESEVAVDASLSSWLLESEKTRKSKNGVASDACDSSDSIKSSNRTKDRPILGEISVNEIKQLSNSSSLRESQSYGRNETPKLGTIGSYWKHTGQATSDSISDSSRKDQGEVKCNSIPFQMRLERAVESGIA